MEIKQIKQFYYRVQPDDNLKILIEKFNTSKENILRNNPQIDLYAGEIVLIKENEYKTHIVKPMQTIEIVAEINNTTAEKIIKDNALQTNKLYIGQQLKIF